ncbi:MAG: family 20 glycosylhydrolase [Muribaculaceae bacterium]|nr:family 20 glycosylhydrolase [Muribaculaceae bacterium]
MLDALQITAQTNAFPVICRIDNEFPYGDSQSDEAYRLSVTEKGVNITSPSSKGLYWGLVTLNQLVKKDTEGSSYLPECEIIDWPAFSIRGFMNDTGRSFISLDELKEEIDVMSRFKLNVFHWHFTENQGWRLESRLFPQLNDSANMLRDHGKYYRIDEARELVGYAADRNITVIPEIDMPGHSKAFDITFGFDMQSPEGVKVVKQLLAEACQTFEEVPYFHIGTDEVKFTNPDFVPEMVRLVREYGKKAISWNPGWKYGDGEIDMIQMWSYRGEPIEGVPAIDSRFHYINHYDTYADIVGLYRSKIYHRENEDDTVKGVVIALWNDRYIDDEKKISVQNNLYPLLMVTAERGWDGGGTEYFDSLGTNMTPVNSADFRKFADFERRMLHHKKTRLNDKNIPYVKQTNVHWLITEAFPNGGDLSAKFPPEIEGPKYEYIYNDSVYKSREATGAGIYLRHVWGNIVPAFYSDPKPDHTAYAFTNVYSPEDQKVGLQFETQNYSRSESDVAPPQGEWDYRCSKLWINGKEIKPREWRNIHKERDNEISLANENMATESPIPVELKKGWNSVMIKLPVGKFQIPEVRLVKWMFTFVFTTPDGKEAAPGLIYIPLKRENEKS